MRGPDITLLKSKRAAGFAILLICCALVLISGLWAKTGGIQDNSQPSQKASEPSSAPPSANSNTRQNSDPNKSPDDTYVIRKDVDEVLLYATVADDKQHLVTNLNRGDFSIFEDGKAQTIISFHHEDIPVAMGIVIDNSGSMREKRAKVNQAALNLVRASNAKDEVFVVNFND
jgi:Ca-activated chloride channel homolog